MTTLPRRPMRPVRSAGGIALPAIGVVLMAALLWAAATGIEVPFAERLEQVLDRAEPISPWVYLVAFLVLPAFGVPILAFYLTIGLVIEGLGVTLVAAWVCMAGNMALSYLIARGLYRPLHRLADRRGYRVPRLRSDDEWTLTLMVRASPLPWMMQNYLLTLGGARFGPYMLLGVPVQALIGLGVILLGDAILSGDLRWALLGLILVMAVVAGLRLLRSRVGIAPADSATPEPVASD